VRSVLLDLLLDLLEFSRAPNASSRRI